MNLKKFIVLKQKKDLEPEGDIFEVVLLNTDHIVSLKPINIIAEESVIKGFWVRMSNDKKYKATKIPNEILSVFDDETTSQVIGKEAQISGNEISIQ